MGGYWAVMGKYEPRIREASWGEIPMKDMQKCENRRIREKNHDEDGYLGGW